MENLASLITDAEHLKQVYQPQIYRLNHPGNKESFDHLLHEKKVCFVADEMYGQLQELVKSLHPSVKKIAAENYRYLIDKHLDGREIDTYGVWVYYPWSKKIVHMLDEEEFIELRTNRNRYKITRDEQQQLRSKKIGIVGLSVGQSIALTMAMERTCGELRLADFDTAELSNLNRIRTGIQNLGLNKTFITAREIAEIDPFINIKVFSDGLHQGNIDEFFTGGGKLDLFVEVCDGLDIKIESRYKARQYNIPVVMDTNDRGMLDVERFDLEPSRPVLHGLADGLDPDTIKDLSNEDKIPYILRMIGADTISTRLKASMLEVQQSINTWPQLASSVTLGGALTTDISRRILLNQYHESGRYYIDMEELVKDKEQEKYHTDKVVNPYMPLNLDIQSAIVSSYWYDAVEATFRLQGDELETIIDAAIAAPSAGNNQPWKWFYSKGVLFLFHDKYRSWSWGDYNEMGAHMGLGAALENVHVQALALGLTDKAELFPLSGEASLVAAIRFERNAVVADTVSVALSKQLFTRRTSRKLEKRQPLPESFFKQLKSVINGFANVEINYTEDEGDLAELSEIIAECDKVRLLNELGHEEFYHELRWNREEAEKTRDGVELASVDISQSDIAGFKVAGDWRAVSLLADWDQGNAFKKLSLQAVQAASAMVLFSIAQFNHTQLIEAGRAVQRAWLLAAQEEIALHPMLSPAFFFNRLTEGHGEGLPVKVAQKLTVLRERFLKIFPIGSNTRATRKEVFLMKVAIAGDIGSRSLRKNKNELFYHDLSN